MGDLIGGLAISDISGWVAFLALAWFVTRQVLKGKLVPGSERDHWRDVADTAQANAIKLSMGLERLTAAVERVNASSDASTRALEALQASVGEGPR